MLPYPPTTAFAERRIRRVTVTQDECIPFPLPVGLAVFVINHTYANGPGVVTAADGDGSAYGRPLTCHYLQLVDAPRPAGLPGCFCAVCVAGQSRFTPVRRYEVIVFTTAGTVVTDRFGQRCLLPRVLSPRAPVSPCVSSVGSPAGPSQAARAPTAGCFVAAGGARGRRSHEGVRPAVAALVASTSGLRAVDLGLGASATAAAHSTAGLLELLLLASLPACVAASLASSPGRSGRRRHHRRSRGHRNAAFLRASGVSISGLEQCKAARNQAVCAVTAPIE